MELRDFVNDVKLLGKEGTKITLLANNNPLVDLLKNQEYDYLRTNKHLGKNIALLTVGGSYAYGTNVCNDEHVSDFDLRGVFTHSKEEILTMNCLDKPLVNRDLDVSIYPMKQFIDLLSKCNPNVIELLGTRDSDIFVLDDVGKMLRDNVDLFLTKRAYYSFGGYALQQLRRLQNALIKEAPKDLKDEHVLKTVLHSSMLIREKYSYLDENGLIDFYIDENDSKESEYNREVFININIDKVPFSQLKSFFSEIDNVIKGFNDLNHRNRKKDESALYKHAMHLIRLDREGIEILRGEGINTYREKDRDFLLDIRNKKYSFEELFEISNELEKELKEAFNNSKIIDKPDFDKVNKLLFNINEIVLSR